MTKEKLDAGNNLLHDMQVLTAIQDTMNKNHWVEFVRAECPAEYEGLNSDVLYADFKDFVDQELEKAKKLFAEL